MAIGLLPHRFFWFSLVRYCLPSTPDVSSTSLAAPFSHIETCLFPHLYESPFHFLARSPHAGQITVPGPLCGSPGAPRGAPYVQMELMVTSNQKRSRVPGLLPVPDGPGIVEPVIDTSPGAASITRNPPLRIESAWLACPRWPTWQYLQRARGGQPCRIRAIRRHLGLTAGIGTEMVVGGLALARGGNRVRWHCRNAVWPYRSRPLW